MLVVLLISNHKIYKVEKEQNPMKDKLIVYLLIGLGILALITALAIVVTRENTESVTEVSFENPTELPQKINLGETYSFTVGVYNKSPLIKDYPYTLSIVYDSKNKELLKRGKISILAGEKRSIEESFSVTEEFDTAKILVTVEDQEIYFWVSQA